MASFDYNYCDTGIFTSEMISRFVMDSINTRSCDMVTFTHSWDDNRFVPVVDPSMDVSVDPFDLRRYDVQNTIRKRMNGIVEGMSSSDVLDTVLYTRHGISVVGKYHSTYNREWFTRISNSKITLRDIVDAVYQVSDKNHTLKYIGIDTEVAGVIKVVPTFTCITPFSF